VLRINDLNWFFHETSNKTIMSSFFLIYTLIIIVCIMYTIYILYCFTVFVLLLTETPFAPKSPHFGIHFAKSKAFAFNT
jgi:hypothetical protein